jgi:hypothetical protein
MGSAGHVTPHRGGHGGFSRLTPLEEICTQLVSGEAILIVICDLWEGGTLHPSVRGRGDGVAITAAG